MEDWPVRLFNKSVLKQRKYREIVALLGPTEGLSCLDIGSDNGVISYLLRRRGGDWKSADLDDQSVVAIRKLVKTEVYPLDGRRTPFQDEEFDRVVIVDFLEHIPDDAGFISEAARIMKPGGELIINVPHRKEGLLRRLRYWLGQTDEKHGHLRPGYDQASIRRLLGDEFALESSKTYSKFFSELVDTLIVFAVSRMQKSKTKSKKGLMVTGEDLNQNGGMFRVFSLIYPIVWLFSRLDLLLFFSSGYMWIGKARVTKPSLHKTGKNGWHKDQLISIR